MLAPWLRLLRAPLAPTAACDALACAVLARELAGLNALELGWEAGLALSATSLCLYGFGMAGNDWMDRKRDRVLAPERPLPAGELGPRRVLVLLVLLAAAALSLGGGAAAWFPGVLLALGLACAYNGGLKRYLVPGALAMGGVRASNAALVPMALWLDSGAPVSVLLAPLCIGLYSASVVVLSTTEDEASRARALACRILASLAFAGAATVSWIAAGMPTLGVFLGYGVVSSLMFGRRPRAGPPKKQVLEMLLALYWLALIVASGAHSAGWAFVLGAFLGAIALVYLSQRWIRALRKPPPDLALSTP